MENQLTKALTLRVAKINLGLILPLDLASAFESQYAENISNGPHDCLLEMRPTYTSNSDTWRATTPAMEINSKSIDIHQEHSWHTHFDLSAKSGLLEYPEGTQAHDRPVPSMVHSALRTFCATLSGHYFDGFFMHSSGLALASQGLAFLGRSGAGKSTVAEMFPKESVLNDDMHFVHLDADQPWLYPTPFSGSYNVRAPIKKIPFRYAFELVQAEDTKVCALNHQEALRILLNCIPQPTGCSAFEDKLFLHATDVIKAVSFYRLDFRVDAASTRKIIDNLLKENHATESKLSRSDA